VIHKCDTKITGRGISLNIQNIQSLHGKYYEHFIKQYYGSSLHIKKIQKEYLSNSGATLTLR
jgi:hypothetical protein